MSNRGGSRPCASASSGIVAPLLFRRAKRTAASRALISLRRSALRLRYLQHASVGKQKGRKPEKSDDGGTALTLQDYRASTCETHPCSCPCGCPRSTLWRQSRCCLGSRRQLARQGQHHCMRRRSSWKTRACLRTAVCRSTLVAREWKMSKW